MATSRSTIVFFDDDCGSCRWSAERLRAWDRKGVLRCEPLDGPLAERSLSRIAPDRRWASWHVMTPDGRVWSGGDAVPVVLRRLPAGAAVAAIASAAPEVTDRPYRWVADRRDAFGRALGERACSVDPSRGRAA